MSTAKWQNIAGSKKIFTLPLTELMIELALILLKLISENRDLKLNLAFKNCNNTTD